METIAMNVNNPNNRKVHEELVHKYCLSYNLKIHHIPHTSNEFSKYFTRKYNTENHRLLVHKGNTCNECKTNPLLG